MFARWKADYVALSDYKSAKPVEYKDISWCELCKKLHTDRVPQTYTSIASFHSPSHCISGKSKILRQFFYGNKSSIDIPISESLKAMASRFSIFDIFSNQKGLLFGCDVFCLSFEPLDQILHILYSYLFSYICYNSIERNTLVAVAKQF